MTDYKRLRLLADAFNNKKKRIKASEFKKEEIDIYDYKLPHH